MRRSIFLPRSLYERRAGRRGEAEKQVQTETQAKWPDLIID